MSKYPTPSRYETAGWLAKDPETLKFEGSEPMLRLTLVDDPGEGKQGTPYGETLFVDVMVTGKRMEYLSKLRKGDPLRVSGKLTIRKYAKKNGKGIDGVGIGAEIRFPDVVQSLVSLADRAGSAETTDNTYPPGLA